MEKRLKLIVDAKGKNIFSDCAQLVQELRQNGSTEMETMTVGLILCACPSVGNVLAQGEQVTRAEIHVLVTSTVAATGLSVHTVRKYLGYFFRACGMKGLWEPKLISNEPQPEITLTPMIIKENETVEELSARLREDKDCTAQLCDLEAMSKNGNVHASYALGKFYKKIDDKYKTKNGKPFFQRAASLGYGPANGALADYEIHGRKMNITKASKYFENPAALFGKDGREWTKLSDQLLQYREENSSRIRKVLWLQLWMLMLTVAVFVLLATQGIIWAVLCVFTQIVGLGWTLFIMLFRPCGSTRCSYYTTLLSWLMLVLSIL